MRDNIEEVTASKELADYIRGEKRYENVRPDVDYTRWFYIADYLKNGESANVKKQVTETLLLLLDSKKWQDIYAVAGICLNINSPEIDKKLEELISQSDFFSLPDELIGFVSKYAIKKHLHLVANKVVENSIRKNRIDWVMTMISSNPNEQEVYWNYCDKIFSDVLLTMNQNEKIQVLEKMAFEKDKTVKFILGLNNNERV